MQMYYIFRTGDYAKQETRANQSYFVLPSPFLLLVLCEFPTIGSLRVLSWPIAYDFVCEVSSPCRLLLFRILFDSENGYGTCL